MSGLGRTGQGIAVPCRRSISTRKNDEVKFCTQPHPTKLTTTKQNFNPTTGGPKEPYPISFWFISPENLIQFYRKAYSQFNPI